MKLKTQMRQTGDAYRHIWALISQVKSF